MLVIFEMSLPSCCGVVWFVVVGGLGRIATIGAALRRVAGASGVYGRKTPEWLLGCAVASPCGGLGLLWWLVVWCLVVCLWCRCGLGRLRWWLGGIATIGAALRRVVGVSGVYGRKTPRVLAQSAVHLGGMRVIWGVWGVVDYGLGTLVRGEAFSAGRLVGYVGPQCVLPG